MRFFYLNLDRRPDRNDLFVKRNSAFPNFERISAVDGHRIERDKLITTGMVSDDLTAYNEGAIGCAISHATVWEYAVRHNEAVTVAEDDAVINWHFMEKSRILIKTLPPDWDLILWGWNFDSVFYVRMLEGIKSGLILLDNEDIGPHLNDFKRLCFDVVALKLVCAFGTVCYSVRPAGAFKLRTECFPLHDENVSVPVLGFVPNSGIDVAMSKQYRNLKAYAAFPPLVISENNRSSSDIQQG